MLWLCGSDAELFWHSGDAPMTGAQTCCSSSSSGSSLLRGKLVRAAWSDRDKIFGGGRGHCQERLSPDPARPVRVRPL